MTFFCLLIWYWHTFLSLSSIRYKNVENATTNQLVAFHRIFLWVTTWTTLKRMKTSYQTVSDSHWKPEHGVRYFFLMPAVLWHLVCSSGLHFVGNLGKDNQYVNSESGSESDWRFNNSLKDRGWCNAVQIVKLLEASLWFFGLL